MGFPGGIVLRNLPVNAEEARDTGSIPGVGNGNPFQYSCLENIMTEEPGELQSTGSQTDMTEHTHIHESINHKRKY